MVPAPITHAVFIVHLSRGLRPRVPPAGPRMRRRPLASLAPLRRRPGRSLLAPLLEEVGHTLLLFLGLVEHSLDRALEENLGILAAREGVESALRETDGHGGLSRDLAREGESARLRLAVRDDLLDEPDREGLVRGDDAAGEDELLRAPEPDDAGEPVAAPGRGDDPEPDLGLPELRRLRRDPHVAGERELASAPEREAVDRRDDGPREVLDLAEQGSVDRPERVLRAALAHLGNVGAGDEALLDARHDEGVDGRVL